MALIVKETEYLIFREEPPVEKRKTKVWIILSRRHGDVLGHVAWYGAWRQYTFRPANNTIWNIACMADVQTFITEQMEARRRT